MISFICLLSMFRDCFSPTFGPFTQQTKSNASRRARFQLQSVSLVDYAALTACTFIVSALTVTCSITRCREDIFAWLHNSLVMAV